MSKPINLTRQVLVPLLALCVSPWATAQVQRYNATSENDYGVVYTLPQTEYQVTLTLLHKCFTPGELAPWAAKYLGKEVEVQERNYYELQDVKVQTIGVADSSKRYVVAFDKKSIAPFVSLMPNGVLYSINGAVAPKLESMPQDTSYPLPDRQMPALSQEYSLATTPSKRAELAASYLYEVREYAMSIVSGSVEQMPKDGESMRLILDKLRTEEKRALRLFEGDTTYRIETLTYRIVPEDRDINDRLLCRISQQWGLVTNDDLSGDALTFSLRILERSPELDPKERQRREKLEGIIYNIPGLGELSLYFKGKQVLSTRVPITQVGSIQSLSKKMFNIKEAGTTAVYLDPHSGALDRVTTE